MFCDTASLHVIQTKVYSIAVLLSALQVLHLQSSSILVGIAPHWLILPLQCNFGNMCAVLQFISTVNMQNDSESKKVTCSHSPKGQIFRGRIAQELVLHMLLLQ